MFRIQTCEKAPKVLWLIPPRNLRRCWGSKTRYSDSSFIVGLSPISKCFNRVEAWMAPAVDHKTREVCTVVKKTLL